VKVPHARNPLAGLLNAIAVIASGVFAGLLGASQQEKNTLQSTISSVCHLQSLINICEIIILALLIASEFLH
jgi:hypothetical protein